MRFKEVLNKYGITQNELAERLGINRVSVSRLFSEKNDMRSSTIIKISEAIGCRAGELYDDYKENDKANKIVCPHCKKEIEFEIKIK